MEFEFLADWSSVPDEHFKFAIIVARHVDRWVLVRHRERTTWEIPAGHREPGEPIVATAQRELQEETGAIEFDLRPVFAFRSPQYDEEGRRTDRLASLLCFAEIKALGPLSTDFEIAEISLVEQLPSPEQLTYPEIQPRLFDAVVARLARLEA
jgi:8-oxo-dGTP diphosphatase